MAHNSRRMNMNRQQQQQRPAMSMSPWEGGFQPGGSGLLPTPNAAPSLLSQLASPEAQLAVASNLLNSLLRPVQNGLQNNQLPSLMGLSTPNLRPFNSGNQSFQYNDNYNDDYQDFRGHMPYRNVDSYRSQRSPMRNSGNRGQRSNRDRDRASFSSQSSKPRSSERHGNKNNDSKSNRNQSERSDTDKDKRGASFEGLPKSAFSCHVCKKNMWDALSFDNHVKGVAHQQMLSEREKGYEVRADLMREEAKVEAHQSQIERERLIRMGKRLPPCNREYCKMCDFSFFGDLASHRKGKSHQQLKNFLHPKCKPCQKEFPVRIDLDKHFVSPDHLKMLYKLDKSGNNDGKGDNEKTDETKEHKEDEEMDVEEEKQGEAKETGSKNNTKEEISQDRGLEVEVEITKLELEVVMEGNAAEQSKETETEQVPSVYNPDVAVGKEFLMPVTGVFCQVCRRFFLCDDEALANHCKSLGHYNNVVAIKSDVSQLQVNSKVSAEKSKFENSDKNALADVDEDSNKYDPFDDEIEALEDDCEREAIKAEPTDIACRTRSKRF